MRQHAPGRGDSGRRSLRDARPCATRAGGGRYRVERLIAKHRADVKLLNLLVTFGVRSTSTGRAFCDFQRVLGFHFGAPAVSSKWFQIPMKCTIVSTAASIS
jgi:hypothetical protein